MASQKNNILSLGKDLSDGESCNVVCPFCDEAHEQQGRPRTWKPNRSMTITRERYSLLYHCFRASCTNSDGVVHILDALDKRAMEDIVHKKEFVPSSYPYRTTALTATNVIPSLEAHELKTQHVKWAIDRHTVAFPIFDILGRTVGVVDRSYRGREPKSITYWFNDVPKIHFPLTERVDGRSVILVEDQVSAIVADRFMRSAALLGTHITSETMNHLRNHFPRLYIALDEDATAQAIRLQKKYDLFFESITVIPLSKDIKDMSSEEFNELFLEYVV